MKKTGRKLIAMVLLWCMVFGLVATPAFATESNAAKEDNVWNGDNVSVAVGKGTDGYAFMSVYQSPYNAYEMSNHMVTNNGGASFDIPQTLMLVDASEEYTWTPNGLYSLGSSNYEVLYCCDAETGYNGGIHYKRLNLEDSEYYEADAAAHIRAIVTNSYPYVSLEQMKANLKAAKFSDADKLTRAEIITAVQAAIWAYANENVGSYVYGRTFDVPSNSQWGGVMHDYTNEMRDENGNLWWTEGRRKFTTDDAVGARINALIEHLKAQTAVYAEKNQIIISDLEIVEQVAVQDAEDVYSVVIRIQLNNSGSSAQDEIMLTVKRDNEVVMTEPVVLGQDVYMLTVQAQPGQTIQAVVSGTQMLPEGVYFYEPEGGRDISQCLVGVAMGETDVYAKKSISLEIEKPKTAELKLQKVDEHGLALPGVEFVLEVAIPTEQDNTDASSRVAENIYAEVKTYTVGDGGELHIDGLLAGKSYQLREVAAPNGYTPLVDPIRFTVAEDTGEIRFAEQTEDVFLDNGVLVVKNYPVVSHMGKLRVEKQTTGNAPQGPFDFRLFVKETQTSPYAKEMNDAKEALDEAIDTALSKAQVTTGSVYAMDGTTMSQYVFTLDGEATMAVTSGSAVQFDTAKALDAYSGQPLGASLQAAIKTELQKSYTDLMTMLKGLANEVETNGQTVVMEEGALQSVMEAGKRYETAVARDANWHSTHKGVSNLKIAIDGTIYTTSSSALTYDPENEWWEIEFQVLPGAENAVGITIESTTGSSISYLINEQLDESTFTEDYLGTVIYDANGTKLYSGVAMQAFIALEEEAYLHSYVFQNNYKPPYTPPYDPPYEPPSDPPNDPPNEPPLTPFEEPPVPGGEPPEFPTEPFDNPPVPLGDAPATGDTTKAVPYVAMMLFALAGLVITRRKYN